MNQEEFDRIKWPEEFYIQFADGQEQLFVSSEGVIWNAGSNNEGSDEGRPSISCCWQKKSPSQQRYKLIEFFADEVVVIKTTSGTRVWAANA